MIRNCAAGAMLFRPRIRELNAGGDYLAGLRSAADGFKKRREFAAKRFYIDPAKF